MSQLNALLTDLRNRKVWPVAAILLASLVAVPVLLSHHTTPTTLLGPTAALPVTATHGVPTVSVNANPQQASLQGTAHDPFTQQAGGTSVAAAAGAGTGSVLTSAVAAAGSAVNAATSGVTRAASSAASTGASGGASSASASANSTGAGSAAPSAPSSGGSRPAAAPAPRPLTPTRPRPAPSGLAADQHYDVALAVTNASGGFTTADPFTRLTAIPSATQAGLVELGVLQGGKQVVFAVAPGATVGGPGTCVPGPLDCEILAIAPGQNETIALPGAGPITFQVTGVRAVTDTSAVVATAARERADAAGRLLVAAWQRAAFALFPYVPSLGAVVDARNLIVGGN